MTFSKVPWLVDGPIVKAELGRSAFYAAMGGASGITNVGDCIVRATTVPSGSVRVGKGTVTILNRYSNAGGGQSYMLDNNADHLIAVPPTGASARSDLVVAAVNDPQYSGDQPADWDTFTYSDAHLVSGVSSGRTDADDFAGPFEALARIDIPPNTSVVTTAMIHDLRRVARPRKDRFLRTTGILTAGTETLNSTATAGEKWPDATTWTIDIPAWATVAKVIGMVAGLNDPGLNAQAAFWVRIGAAADAAAVETQTRSWNSPSTGGATRPNVIVSDDIAIPAGLRGRNVPVYIKGRYTTAPSSSAKLKVDGGSTVSVDIEFDERATTDV